MAGTRLLIQTIFLIEFFSLAFLSFYYGLCNSNSNSNSNNNDDYYDNGDVDGDDDICKLLSYQLTMILPPMISSSRLFKQYHNGRKYIEMEMEHLQKKGNSDYDDNGNDDNDDEKLLNPANLLSSSSFSLNAMTSTNDVNIWKNAFNRYNNNNQNNHNIKIPISVVSSSITKRNDDDDDTEHEDDDNAPFHNICNDIYYYSYNNKNTSHSIIDITTTNAINTEKIHLYLCPSSIIMSSKTSITGNNNDDVGNYGKIVYYKGLTFLYPSMNIESIYVLKMVNILLRNERNENHQQQVQQKLHKNLEISLMVEDNNIHFLNWNNNDGNGIHNDDIIIDKKEVDYNWKLWSQALSDWIIHYDRNNENNPCFDSNHNNNNIQTNIIKSDIKLIPTPKMTTTTTTNVKKRKLNEYHYHYNDGNNNDSSDYYYYHHQITKTEIESTILPYFLNKRLQQQQLQLENENDLLHIIIYVPNQLPLYVVEDEQQSKTTTALMIGKEQLFIIVDPPPKSLMITNSTISNIRQKKQQDVTNILKNTLNKKVVDSFLFEHCTKKIMNYNKHILPTSTSATNNAIPVNTGALPLFNCVTLQHNNNDNNNHNHYGNDDIIPIFFYNLYRFRIIRNTYIKVYDKLIENGNYLIHNISGLVPLSKDSNIVNAWFDVAKTITRVGGFVGGFDAAYDNDTTDSNSDDHYNNDDGSSHNDDELFMIHILRLLESSYNVLQYAMEQNIDLIKPMGFSIPQYCAILLPLLLPLLLPTILGFIREVRRYKRLVKKRETEEKEAEETKTKEE